MSDTKFRWELIDHRLVSLKLTDLTEEASESLRTEIAQIRFDNRNNQNTQTVPSLIIAMHLRRTEEWIEKTYSVYCEVWEKQGQEKTAEFIRAVASHTLPTIIAARTHSIVSQLSQERARTGSPIEPHNARMVGLKHSMQRLEARWARKLEIEARECRHRERHQHPTTAEVDDLKTVVAGAPTASVRNSKPARRYRSQLKRAILMTLLKNPQASDLEVCRAIDDDGAVELRGSDRTAESAYRDPRRRSSFQSAISKVRRDMRQQNLL